jgi:hypothetical protein
MVPNELSDEQASNFEKFMKKGTPYITSEIRLGNMGDFQTWLHEGKNLFER